MTEAIWAFEIANPIHWSSIRYPYPQTGHHQDDITFHRHYWEGEPKARMVVVCEKIWSRLTVEATYSNLPYQLEFKKSDLCSGNFGRVFFGFFWFEVKQGHLKFGCFLSLRDWCFSTCQTSMNGPWRTNDISPTNPRS